MPKNNKQIPKLINRPDIYSADPVSNKEKIQALVQEYQRAVTDPVHDEPALYCLILDLLADELERLGLSQEKLKKLIDFSQSPY
jgi:hypothetical protein